MILRNATRPEPGAWRLSWTLGRPEFAAAIAVAVVWHLALLLPATASPGSPSAPHSVAAMQVRMLRPDPSPANEEAIDRPAPETTLQAAAEPPVAPAADRTAPGPAPSDARSIPILRGPLTSIEASSPNAPATPPVARGAASTTPPLSQKAVPAEAALPPAPDYLFGSKLDTGPRPLDDIDLQYPSEGQLQEGSVTLRLLISETGHVDNVAVVRSYPPGLFDRAAIEAFSAARFAPALLFGIPTKSQFMTEVQFTPFNRGSRVSGRGY